VTLVDGVSRQIEWPENSFMHAPLPGAGRDAIILLGVEPNLRWKTFSGRVTRVAQEFRVELVITLGSLLADVPHTRPSPVTGSATDPDLIDQLGLQASRYEGPTGMVGVLHDACSQAGLKSASLWAAVPHYVSLTPSPRAAKALVDRLAELLHADVDTDELDEAADAYAEQVSEAVASDEETAAYVQELERRVDELEDESDLPTGDAIAAELTRFLRERENQNGDDDVARG
ncbi:MAG TPA: PAC2 family protein, partial [Gaiellaceae bacterium]|nr:PAC2 family protein [Gaiellaceae bacterium]